MSDHLPSVTVLVPTRPDGADVKAVQAAQGLDYPSDKLEILVARGRQPSVQRNTGLRAAKGELIYFLDDDSIPDPGNLRRALAHFANPNVKMVGGPNVCPADASENEQVFALILGSWLAFGPSRARYTPVGTVRESGEKELILCNLMARRDAVMELGGFDEALYPNEENALMDELQKRGGKLIHDPDFVVKRRPRPTLKAFAHMLMNYGRGRAEQFRAHPTFGSVLNFVPPLFLVYLIILLGIWAIPSGNGLQVYREFFSLPFGCYLLAVLVQGIAFVPKAGVRRSLCALLLLLISSPGGGALYGFGFWRGLFTVLKPPGMRSDVPVALERMGSS